MLAVQSHVVHGYVGNKAATLPLQLRGWDVDGLNVVQFSNHTGYGHVEGYKIDGNQIRAIFTGLETQEFEYAALLSGYLPSADAVEAIGEIGAKLRQQNPKLLWVLDPVMGDAGKLYVKEDVIPMYKKILKTNSVTLTTPNHFEVEILTGIPLTSRENVLRALQYMHTEYNVEHVVISSVPHATDKNVLLTVGSSRVGGEPFVIRQHKIDTYFTGTGDLFAALMLDAVQRLGVERLADATCCAISVIGRVLQRTYEYSCSRDVTRARISSKAMRFHELRLVQSADIFLSEAAQADVQWTTY